MAQDLGVRVCEVISTSDDFGAGRIKVRILPEDSNKTDDQLPWAFPVSPKIFFITPKVGEGVLVFLANPKNANSVRYYFGPLTSQLTKLYSEPFSLGSEAIFSHTLKQLPPSPSTKPDLDGLFPNKEDVAVLGRKNCDIILKEDDIRIRAGVKLVNDKNHFQMSYNEENPAYIKIAYNKEPIIGAKSTAVVTADKIFLLGNTSKEIRPSADRESLISNEMLQQLLDEGYKLPYGEKLIEFLLKFVDVFSKHTHDYVSLPPNKSFIAEINNAAQDPLNNKKMLSDTVIIN